MNDQNSHQYDVAIVGSGYSGTMVAVHLLEAKKGLRIALIERGKVVGRGVAYGTTDNKHLLNVRACEMGAYPDDVQHFYRWLEAHPQNVAAADITELLPDAFVPRLIFGDYLQDLLQKARKVSEGLEILHDEVEDIERLPEGDFRLMSKKGIELKATQVVLAFGNFPPNKIKKGSQQDCPWFSDNPYSAQVCAELAKPGDVLIIGTGLTSLDVMLTVAPLKREGTIHFLSRGGRFPQPHKRYTPYQPFLDHNNLPKTCRNLLRLVHQELRTGAAKGFDWRAVIDSLRPFNQNIWKTLDHAERRRFLRHLRSLWDTHRHRCAPEIMAAKMQLEAEGRVVSHRGHILGYRPVGDQVDVDYRPSGTQEKKTLRVRRVLSCAGPQSDYRKLEDNLVRHLLNRDLLAPDPLRMGAHTCDGEQVCNRAGEPIPYLYILGSPQKGRLYESVAVPELRGQAAAVSKHILDAAGTSSLSFRNH